MNALVDNYERSRTGKVPGIAKASFEQAIDKMMQQNQNQKLNGNIIEGYSYLSAYYINNGDLNNTIKVNQQILTIDPNDANAITVLDKLKAPRTAPEPKTNKAKNKK